MPKTEWKPWHEVAPIRDDLKSGELPLHMFASDLYEVVMQRGKQPVYEAPAEFFALTYPTYNIRELAKDVVLRLAVKNDKAVRQLSLTYGGGKTHTLITLYHLVRDPQHLPKLPAVEEFVEHIGMRPPKARIAALCFDKLDVQEGMEVRAPDGSTKWLKQPWSVLAYQIAGSDGLKIINRSGGGDERETAPAENLLTELLEAPGKEGLPCLILIDEVLMYAREKVGQSREWRGRLLGFFQYLTQAATKVNGCCVVASLLATDPKKSDKVGEGILNELYDVFQREREETVQPVLKEDVGEILRRRLLAPGATSKPDSFRPHVMAALKGIGVLDEQTRKGGPAVEERFLKSFPFHPDLTEVFYEKWTQLRGFQRTRGVLRTFALALREAANWDQSPLVSVGAFLAAPEEDALSEAARELVNVANQQSEEGTRHDWGGIVEGELRRARDIQKESVGIKFREIEQAAFATFMHSQPVGRTAQTRDLALLAGSTRPDKIELEKALVRWAQTSHWLDDRFSNVGSGQLPGEWRLGNRPNLVQMHAEACRRVSDDVVEARLIDEIGRLKMLTAGASALGVSVHTLPAHPNDVKDDGGFHYAVMGPSAACESGKPSPLARRFLDETTNTEKPRVYRNAVVLAAPSKDGMEVARRRVRDYMGWEEVKGDIKKQEGEIDPVRAQSLLINVDQARKRIPDSIAQAYCIVVTVSEKNEAHAFKVTPVGEPLFCTIKADQRSRIQDTAITADALLPEGPYDLWRKGETARRVKDLVGAFAQLPHLPKMLNTGAILDTLVDGCQQGSFVLRLVRPDRTSRSWWRCRPDDAALRDPALEVVLNEASELSDLPSELLVPGALPGLWDDSAQITLEQALKYFSGGKVVQVVKGGYTEAVTIPKAVVETVERAVEEAVRRGCVWLTSGPATILGEDVPAGVLTPAALLRVPPPAVTALELLPDNLPAAWKKGAATGLSIAAALSQKADVNLPWKTVRDAIDSALRARFLERDVDSGPWPCDFAGASALKLKAAATRDGGGHDDDDVRETKALVASGYLEEAHQLQNLGDAAPTLFDIKAKSGIPIRFRIQIEVGDGKTPPPQDIVERINAALKDVSKGLELGKRVKY